MKSSPPAGSSAKSCTFAKRAKTAARIAWTIASRSSPASRGSSSSADASRASSARPRSPRPRITRRRDPGVSILDIRVLGDPILREETKPIGEITDDVRRLVHDMFETMYLAKGIGLAAPQVGRTERVAVVDVDEQPIVIINPEIIESDSKIAKAEEGCL